MKKAVLLSYLLFTALSGRAQVFVLDPGHGGDDLGAVVKGRYEKAITLAIARRLKDKLEKSGAAARLTRDGDVFVPLDRRVDMGESGFAFVSLHLNDVRSRKRQGITVYAFGRDRERIPRKHRKHAVPPLAAPPLLARRESAALASSLVGVLKARGFRVDAPARAGFYVLKNPDVPSVLIELGYLSNPKEAARLEDPSYQDRLADALAASLGSFYAAQAARPVYQLEAKARPNAAVVSTGGSK